MKPFIVAFLLLGSSLAEVLPAPSGSTGGNTQFAEARESHNWGESDSSFGASSYNPTYANPVPYSSAPVYANDPAWNAYEQSSGFSVSNSFLGGDLISIGLNIVLGLFAFSLVMQIVTKLASSTLFDNLFDGRSMSSDEMVHYANLAMEAYHKYEELNKTPK